MIICSVLCMSMRWGGVCRVGLVGEVASGWNWNLFVLEMSVLRVCSPVLVLEVR